jgi:para-nitrobenzyl esterase
MLWIHGGVFKTGSLSGYDGASLTNSPWTGQEQIVVTINYRLGVFGFLATNQLRNRDGTSGNYGLLDQQAAMLWVSENIFSFGGDPSALTIVGESAGGFSVLVHLATRAQQEPYFRGAVVQSGVIIDFDAIPWEEAVQTGQEILNQANCTDVDCLRKVDAKTLLSISDHHKTRPTVDGMFLSRPVMDSIRDGDFNKVPIIIGSTKSEFSDFFCNSRYTANMTMANVTNTLYDVYGRRDGGVVLQYYDFSDYPTTRDALIDIYADMTVHCPTKKAASYLSKFTDTYFYTFERDVDALNSSCLGAYHNVDGTYLFPSLLARKGVELTHDEEWTSSYIQSLWLMFSNTPDEPTGKIQNLPTWTKFDSVMQNELVINDRNESIIRTQYYDRVCEMWDEPYKQMLITMGVVMGAFSLGIVMIVLVCVVPYFVTKWRLYQTKKKESVQYEELVE